MKEEQQQEEAQKKDIDLSSIISSIWYFFSCHIIFIYFFCFSTICGNHAVRLPNSGGQSVPFYSRRRWRKDVGRGRNHSNHREKQPGWEVSTVIVSHSDEFVHSRRKRSVVMENLLQPLHQIPFVRSRIDRAAVNTICRRPHRRLDTSLRA